MTFLLPPYGTATLNLPKTMAPDTFARLQAAIDRVLGDPHLDTVGGASNDPGSIEVDSWSVRSQ